MTIKNLRCEARLEAHVPVVIVRGWRTVALVTHDVSFRGMFLLTEEPLPLRSLVRMRVALPGSEIEAHAMVVHLLSSSGERGAGAGLQFWGLAGPARTAWDDYVRILVLSQRRESMRATSSVPPPPPSSGNLESSTIRATALLARRPSNTG